MAWLFDFRGSIGRLEWWALQFICMTINIGLVALVTSMVPGAFEMSAEQLENTVSQSPILWAPQLAFGLISTWICIVSMIKRFHDRGRSGFWLLTPIAPALLGIPFLVVIVALVILIDCAFFPGRDDNNPYASAPKSMSKAELIQSVRDGAGIRPEVRALNSTAKSDSTRQPVQINTPVGTGFGRRTTTPFST